MTSTNDGKDVKSNQTSGHKGKTYYIELYKTLEAQLSEECDLRERTEHLCEAWRRVHSLCQHSSPPTHSHLLSWLQRHTAKTLLQTEWQSPKSKDEHIKLEEAINFYIEECKSAIATRDGSSPQWETQLLQRGEWFKKILPNPWGHSVLRVLLDPNETQPSDAEVLEWLIEERGVMFVTRLRQLAASKCEDLALTLASAIMDRVRATTDDVSDVEQAEGSSANTQSESSKPTFADILRTEAGFTVEVWELLTDIELVLLHKRDKHSQCIALAKKVPLSRGYQLVERLRSRLEISPREKKLWKNAKDVATLVAQVVIARCMVVPVCTGQARSALFWCARALVRVVAHARLPAAAAALAAPAPTARHLHTLAAAVHAQSTEDMKPFVCELYVRAITAGMNELEKLKLKTEKEAEARAMEQTLCTWFTQLGSLLSASARILCECTLTAFSVHPSPVMYEKIKSAPMLPPVAIDVQEAKEETKSEFGSWANDSRSQTNFVKTSETLNLKHTQQQANVLSTAIFAEGETLGLGAELCQDLTVCLSGPRVKTLSWDMDRDLLLENCRTYMDRTNGGTRALTTELKYLNLDPSVYEHLPEIDEDENDIYYGIEKGYEHLVEFQESEPIWQDALFDEEQTESACSSSMELDFITVRRKKKKNKNRNNVVSSEEDSDPLSLVAEAKRSEKKKERPHSKERKKKSLSEDNKESNPEKGKEKTDNKEKKKERKERKKKEREKEKHMALIDPKPGSLASLLGMKIARITDEKVIDTKLTPCATDSDYDSQGKSSLASVNSESNDPSVVFDGLFSMDDFKSPDSSDPLAIKAPLSNNSEMTVTNGVVAVNKAQVKQSLDKSKPQSLNIPRKDSKPPAPIIKTTKDYSIPSILRIPKPSYTGQVNEDVRRSIKKLLQFRRKKYTSQNSPIQKSLNNQPEKVVQKQRAISSPDFPIQPFITPKAVTVPEIPKAYISKEQVERSNQNDSTRPVVPDAQNNFVDESNSYVKSNNLITMSSLLKYKNIMKAPNSENNQMANLKQKPLNSNIVSLLNRQPSNDSIQSPCDNNSNITDESGKSFDDFLRELQESINAGTGSNKSNESAVTGLNLTVKKEMKPTSRVPPVIFKEKSESASSLHCAKQIVQQKKTDNAPNTFSRLSYMHKNKQSDIKLKQALDTMTSRQDQLIKQAANNSMALAKSIVDYKCAKSKYMQTKGDTVITRVENTTLQPEKSSLSMNNDRPTILQGNLTHHLNLASKNDWQIKNSQRSSDNVHPSNVIQAIPNKSTYLSEKDQNDLILLLRQQNRINASSSLYTNKIVHNIQTPSKPLNDVSISLVSKSKPDLCIQNVKFDSKLGHQESKIKPVSISVSSNVKQYDVSKSKPDLSIQNVKFDSNSGHQESKIKPVCIPVSSDVKQYDNRKKLEETKCEYVRKPVINYPRVTISTAEVDNVKKITPKENLESNKLDWETVMNAIRAQKTPSRGPSALEVALSTNPYSENSLRNQRIVRTNPLMETSTIKTVAEIKNNTTNVKTMNDPIKQTIYGKALIDVKAVNQLKNYNQSAQIDAMKQSDIVKTVAEVVRQSNSVITSTPVTTVLKTYAKDLTKQIQVETPKTKKLTQTKKSKKLEASKLSPLEVQKKHSYELSKDKDPFISGIQNSDYDLLEELMDDELRQEIGELSSDEDSYRVSGLQHLKEQKNTCSVKSSMGLKQYNCLQQGKAKSVGLKYVPDTPQDLHQPPENKSTVQMPVLKCSYEPKPSNIAKVTSASANNLSCKNALFNSNKHSENAVSHNVPTLQANSVKQPPNMSIPNVDKTTFLVGSDKIVTHAHVTDSRNIFIATVPQPPPIQKVVVIGPEVYYDPFVAVQRQMQPDLSTINQAQFVPQSNAQNITLYQTTQFAAPVVSPLIIGNAISVPVRPSPVVPFNNAQNISDQAIINKQNTCHVNSTDTMINDSVTTSINPKVKVTFNDSVNACLDSKSTPIDQLRQESLKLDSEIMMTINKLQSKDVLLTQKPNVTIETSQKKDTSFKSEIKQTIGNQRQSIYLETEINRKLDKLKELNIRHIEHKTEIIPNSSHQDIIIKPKYKKTKEQDVNENKKILNNCQGGDIISKPEIKKTVDRLQQEETSPNHAIKKIVDKSLQYVIFKSEVNTKDKLLDENVTLKPETKEILDKLQQKGTTIISQSKIMDKRQENNSFKSEIKKTIDKSQKEASIKDEITKELHKPLQDISLKLEIRKTLDKAPRHHTNVKPQMTRNLDKPPEDINPQTEMFLNNSDCEDINFKEALDINCNKNCERKVLSEVKENKKYVDADKIQKCLTISTDLMKVEETNNEEKSGAVLKDIERLKTKRLAIINRKINHQCFLPPIPLSYSSLVKEQCNVSMSENNTKDPSINAEKITEMNVQMPPNANIESSRVADRNFPIENCKENKNIVCRRILLRSSNRNVSEVSMETKLIARKTKVRLKVDTPTRVTVESAVTSSEVQKKKKLKKNLLLSKRNKKRKLGKESKDCNNKIAIEPVIKNALKEMSSKIENRNKIKTENLEKLISVTDSKSLDSISKVENSMTFKNNSENNELIVPVNCNSDSLDAKLLISKDANENKCNKIITRNSKRVHTAVLLKDHDGRPDLSRDMVNYERIKTKDVYGLRIIQASEEKKIYLKFKRKSKPENNKEDLPKEDYLEQNLVPSVAVTEDKSLGLSLNHAPLNDTDNKNTKRPFCKVKKKKKSDKSKIKRKDLGHNIIRNKELQQLPKDTITCSKLKQNAIPFKDSIAVVASNNNDECNKVKQHKDKTIRSKGTDVNRIDFLNKSDTNDSFQNIFVRDMLKGKSNIEKEQSSLSVISSKLADIKSMSNKNVPSKTTDSDNRKCPENKKCTESIFFPNHMQSSNTVICKQKEEDICKQNTQDDANKTVTKDIVQSDQKTLHTMQKDIQEVLNDNNQHDSNNFMTNNKVNSKSHKTDSSQTTQPEHSPNLKKSRNMSTEDKSDMYKSLMDKIVIQEVPCENDAPRMMRIKLPNGKIFKATIYGELHTTFDALLKDPSIKSMLMSDMADDKRYTLNIKQVSTTSNSDPTKPIKTRIQAIEFKTKPRLSNKIETIDLLSDDDDVQVCRMLNTEFGEYKILLEDSTIIAKHQAKFNQKCYVKLYRLKSTFSEEAATVYNNSNLVKTYETRENLNKCNVSDTTVNKSKVSDTCINNNLNNDITEIIELDDSSNDSIDILKSCPNLPISLISTVDDNIKEVQRVDSFKLENKLQNNDNTEKNVVTNLPDKLKSTISDSDFENAQVTKKDETQSNDISKKDNISDVIDGQESIIPDREKIKKLSQNSHKRETNEQHLTDTNCILTPEKLKTSINCFVKLTKCETLINHYKYLNIVKQKCFVDLVKCDGFLTSQNTKVVSGDDVTKEVNDENHGSTKIEINTDKSTISDEQMASDLSRCPSSILNDYGETWNDVNVNNGPNDKIFVYDRCSSPVMEIYDTIVSIQQNSNSFSKVIQKDLSESLRCECEWFFEKKSMRSQYISEDRVPRSATNCEILQETNRNLFVCVTSENQVPKNTVPSLLSLTLLVLHNYYKKEDNTISLKRKLTKTKDIIAKKILKSDGNKNISKKYIFNSHDEVVMIPAPGHNKNKNTNTENSIVEELMEHGKDNVDAQLVANNVVQLTTDSFKKNADVEENQCLNMDDINPKRKIIVDILEKISDVSFTPKYISKNKADNAKEYPNIFDYNDDIDYDCEHKLVENVESKILPSDSITEKELQCTNVATKNSQNPDQIIRILPKIEYDCTDLIDNNDKLYSTENLEHLPTYKTDPIDKIRTNCSKHSNTLSTEYIEKEYNVKSEHNENVLILPETVNSDTNLIEKIYEEHNVGYNEKNKVDYKVMENINIKKENLKNEECNDMFEENILTEPMCKQVGNTNLMGASLTEAINKCEIICSNESAKGKSYENKDYEESTVKVLGKIKEKDINHIQEVIKTENYNNEEKHRAVILDHQYTPQTTVYDVENLERSRKVNGLFCQHEEDCSNINNENVFLHSIQANNKMDLPKTVVNTANVNQDESDSKNVALLCDDNATLLKNEPADDTDLDKDSLKKVALLYKDDSTVITGIEFEDPVVGTCYVFPVTRSTSLSSDNDTEILSNSTEEVIQVVEGICDDIHLNHCDLMDDCDDLKLIAPTNTYSKSNKYDEVNLKGTKGKKCLKRKIEAIEQKFTEKKYRKGKNIDYPKITVTAMVESGYSKEYKRVFDYCNSLKFSYSQPFHKEHIDVDGMVKDWPIRGTCPVELPSAVNENNYNLFVDDEHIFTQYNPMDQTLTEEITKKYDQGSESANEIIENNFNMGFGEGSGRVIQNLKDIDDVSKVSAATLSDVKQPQPFLLSEDYDCKGNEYTQNLKKCDEFEKIKRYITYMDLRNKVRSFFERTSIELKCDWQRQIRKGDFHKSDIDSSNFPFDFYIRDFMEPPPVEVIVQVVQVGQLPVSAAAQNPVTCDPRVTQVSDASPSQCSVENSPHDDSSSAIKTEYTELTTADLTLPLVQDYAQHHQAMPHDSHETPNLQMNDENIPIETEIKSVVKIELMEELPEDREDMSEVQDSVDAQSMGSKHVNNIEYTYDTNNTNTTLDDSNMQILYNSTEKQSVQENFPQQKQQNGSSEKTDQIAHAMNAAGITTTTETIANNRAHALVNILSQKIRQGAVTSNTQTTTNTYPKATSINAMSLQQALAQILPPPLNQTNVTENNQQTANAQVAPQVLHIVQGKNATGSQITLVDNSQQSVINSPNATPVLHIVQNKSAPSGVTANGTPGTQTNSFSGLSLVDAGLQQGGNQLLHIVNTGSQKNANTGQLLKRVNLLTNLANVQGSNDQKMVQFVCKSADGKAIQLNAPHQRSMVLRLQPIESPNVQSTPPKTIENQDLQQPTVVSLPNKDNVTVQQEIKSRSVYEENYAKFIQNSSSKQTLPEKSTSLPKFNQAFGKPVFTDGNQKTIELNSNNSHISSVNTPAENSECQTNDNAINLDHISQISSPPLLLRKSPAQTSQSQPNLVQQIKQTIAPMNIQTMHGGVIYTRQIPVNIGGGQTINLITVPSTELIDDSAQKQQSDIKFVNQGELEPSIIKIIPQSQTVPNSEIPSEDNGNTHIGVTNENAQNPQPQPQPVLTQMRIKLPMLSKTPQMVSGARVVRPSFFQIQRNVIGGANQPVYQQLVLTAAPPLGQQTIRLPQAQPANRQIKVPTDNQTSTESQMSSSTLEQLREFDMVLEQVKERSTVQPNTNSNSTFNKLHTPSTDTTDNVASSSANPAESTQVLYSIGNNQPLNVAYVNRKATVTTPTTSTFVRSPDSSGIADSPTSSTHVQIPHTVTTETSPNETPSQPKPAKVGSKSKSRPKSSSNPPNSLKLNTVPPKTSAQKPLEDEQTTQRILYILAEYKEQVENSPDKDKPAPRRRSNPPSNPSGSSKRKKSSSSSRRPGVRDVSPIHGDDTCRTMGSEDSSCGTSQGDCNESCLDSHSPQDSPRKIVRKLTFEQETTPVVQPRTQPQRNVIVADGQTITVARGTAGKPATAVLMPANYILPVSMVKGGQQIAIVTNRGPKLLTVGGGESGATNALLLQRLIGPAGLKPVLARPGVRHVRLPTAALHNLQTFNLATAATVQPPDSTASPAPAPTPPELVESRAASSPWTDRESGDAKPDRGSSPEGSEPWNLPSSADPHDYTYEETVRADNMDRTVLVVQKKDGTSQRQHRLTHVSAAALRHKYAILEHELRLQKSLSEECEDLGVDSPSASELFPEAELLFAASPAHDHTQDHAQQSHTPQPTLLNQSGIPQPDIDDQIATDQLLPRESIHEDRQDLNLGLEDVGIVTVSEDGMQATIALDQEEFARSHPNTTFHSEPTDEGEVQPFTIAGLKGRHITSTIFHSNRAPATVLMTTPQTTVISQAAAESNNVNNAVKYSDIDNMINSLPSSHSNNINLSSVLVKDDGLTRFDNILNDSRELHLTNTASAIVHSTGNATQVIRRVCYDDKRERDSSFLMDESDTLIAGDDAKMIAEDSSRDATLESMGGDVDDDRSSPERHAELFWESNSASERSESRRPLDFSSDSDKCCKSPSYDETNSTDSSGVGTHMRLDSVIKEARGIERSGSADGSSTEDTHPPLRTYPPKRMYHALEGEMERSLSGKTRAGERSPDSLEVRRRASGRGVVKRGCHCCNGSPAPPRPKKPRQRKPTMDFTTN